MTLKTRRKVKHSSLRRGCARNFLLEHSELIVFGYFIVTLAFTLTFYSNLLT